MSLNCTTNYLKITVPSKIKIEHVFKRIINYVSTLLKIKESLYFDVTITNKSNIQKINKLHRKINKPTDVLSFAFHDVKPKTSLLGEILINWDDVLKFAKQNKTTYLFEIANLFIHGLLHLLQYDHQNIKSYKKMITIQNKIIKELEIS